MSGRPYHHVQGSCLRLERETLPFGLGRSSKPKFAGGPQRESEYPVEVGLVAMPADADANVVFGTKDLLDPGVMATATERFNSCDDRAQPVGNGLCFLQSA